MDATWKLIASGRFSSESNGAERGSPLALQDFGLDVSGVLVAVLVTGRSSTAAKVRLRVDEGANDDLNALLPGAVDLIALTTVTANLPRTLKGTVLTGTLPYLRPVLFVSSTNATEEYVDVKVYGGGRAF